MNLYTLQQRYRAGSARRGQGGFTMVELAIVLVIAGIILMAALKGTDMINKAKIERTVSDIRGLQGMILEHEKRTGRLAGDCNGDGIIGVTEVNLEVTYMGPSGAGAASYDLEPNPSLAGAAAGAAGTACLNSGSPEADINTPWKDLRKANIVDPSRSNQVLARNQTNDFYGIGSVTMGGAAPAAGGAVVGAQLVNVITVHGIPMWMAKGIDVAMDGVTLTTSATADGGNMGRVRLLTAAAPGGSVWPAGAGSDENVVAISFQFDRMVSQ